MTSEQLIEQIKSFLNRQTPQEMERRFLRLAFDVRDMARQRVQTLGTDSEGRRFVPYTPDYARQRKKKGFQIRTVDYTRSGRLWGNIIPQVVSNNGETIVIEVAPRGRENEVKLLGPGSTKPRKDGEKRGLVTLPSQAELDEAWGIMLNEIVDDFERTLV